MLQLFICVNNFWTKLNFELNLEHWFIDPGELKVQSENTCVNSFMQPKITVTRIRYSRDRACEDCEKSKEGNVKTNQTDCQDIRI